MRIALLSTYAQSDGIATYAESLVEALRAQGTEVHVVSPRLQSGDRPIGPQPPRLWRANRALGVAAFEVARAISAARCDLVHLQVNLSLFSSRFLLDLALILKARGVPLVWTMHGRKGGSWGRSFKVWRIYRVLRGADAIVHNESHADELRAHGCRNVNVIPHGLPPVELLPMSEARAAIGLDTRRRVIAHFGFLVPDKGVLELMHAVAELRRSRFPDLFYWISGAVYRTAESRRYFELLRGEVARLDLADHVHLTGDFVPHEAATRAMQAADWIVLNYLSGNAQGSSGAVTRALASGRPVAVSAAPVFDDVRRAVHTLPADVDLTRSVGDALADDDLTQETKSRAAAYCEEVSWPRVAAKHRVLYDSLVERARLRRR
jgi:glycosyltransferase involved in cell wall biosynthesis